MKFPSSTGTGRIFTSRGLFDVSWHPAYGSTYVKQVMLPNGRRFEVSDYDDRFDFHYFPSDDGYRFYDIMVLLSPNETDPVGVPTAAELEPTVHDSMKPLFDAGSDVAVEDLQFARNLFSKPECMLRYWQKHGSIDAARHAILEDIWGI